jgi:hypothetical protein
MALSNSNNMDFFIQVLFDSFIEFLIKIIRVMVGGLDLNSIEIGLKNIDSRTEETMCYTFGFCEDRMMTRLSRIDSVSFEPRTRLESMLYDKFRERDRIIEELEIQVQGCKEGVKFLKFENIELKKEMKSVKLENTELKKEMKSVKLENTELKNAFQHSTEDIEQLWIENKELKKENTELKLQIETQKNEFEDHLKNEFSDLKVQLAELMADKKKRDGSLNKFNFF